MVATCKSKAVTGRAGLTLVETVMVAGIVGVMIAVALPALQAAREEGRSLQCMDNLKRIGIAVQGYFDAQRAYPPGAVARVDIQYSGFNYVRWLLPHMDETAIYDVVEKGMSHVEGGNLVANPTLRFKLSGKSLPWLSCPSSPHPVMSEWPPYNLGQVPVLARFQNLDYSACTGSYESQHRVFWTANPLMRKGFSGLMPQFYMQSGFSLHSSVIGGTRQGKYGVRLREVTDGTSKTLAVVETSGTLFDANGGAQSGRTASNFLIGHCCADWQPTSHVGTTTISLSVGMQSREAVGAVGGGHPITSGHGPSGFTVFADGSVHLLTEDVDLQVLFALADRNDGVILPDGSFP